MANYVQKKCFVAVVYLLLCLYGVNPMISVPSSGVNGLSSFSSLWAIAEAARAGASDAQAAAKGFLPAVGSVLCATAHATGFAISYAVVFPVYLVARVVPRNNPIVFGLADGGRAGLDLAKETLQPAPQTMLTLAAVQS